MAKAVNKKSKDGGDMKGESVKAPSKKGCTKYLQDPAFAFLAVLTLLLAMSTVYFAFNPNCPTGAAVVPSTPAPGDETPEPVPEPVPEPPAPGPEPVLADPIGRFDTVDAEICTENGKPIIIMVGSSTCPFCTWSDPNFAAIAAEYEGKIAAYNWQVNTGDNLLTAEKETQVPQDVLDLYKKVNPRGGVPTFVFGCRYYRIGQPYRSSNDAEGDKAEMREVIDALIAAA
jgi:thiol-disulfide isomerase/thioredoxin